MDVKKKKSEGRETKGRGEERAFKKKGLHPKERRRKEGGTWGWGFVSAKIRRERDIFQE